MNVNFFVSYRLLTRNPLQVLHLSLLLNALREIHLLQFSELTYMHSLSNIHGSFRFSTLGINLRA